LIVVEILFNGTAWLSSVRVVECNIQLFNERNLLHKYLIYFLLKITGYRSIICLTKIYNICVTAGRVFNSYSTVNVYIRAIIHDNYK